MNPPLPPISLTPSVQGYVAPDSVTGSPIFDSGYAPSESQPSTLSPQLPHISQREANWHTHVAGLKAEEEAKKAGVDPDSAAVLLNAACGGIQLAGYTFPPLTAGFVLMLPMLERAQTKCLALSGDGGQIMAMAFALAYPADAWKHLQGEDLTSFQQRVWDFCQPFSAVQLKQLSAWIGAELTRLRGDAEDAGVGKP